MRKEVTVTHEIVACEVCERTILKGERTEPYLVQDGSRRLVCELCMRRAESAGWIREAAHADMPSAPLRAEPRPSLLERFRSRWRENNPGAGRREDGDGDGHSGAPAPAPPAEGATYVEPRRSEPLASAEPPEPEPEPEEPRVDDVGLEPAQPYGRRRRDPRHVRAVPTNAEAKVERALEVFNGSDYRRTVGGLVRTLGEPWVSALPVLESTSEVVVVVAWELSWYQYRVDLGDGDYPVMLTDKGKELNELDVTLREWNGVADMDGGLSIGVPRAR